MSEIARDAASLADVGDWLHPGLADTFGDWTLMWILVAEGSGRRVLLEHSGFDLDRPADRFAFEQMGPGWRDDVLPRLAVLVEQG